MYEHFRTVMPHSDDDIRRFESIHRGIIEERLVNYGLNPNAVVTKMSLSLLYGSIVCTVMSDSFNYPPSNLKEVKKQKKLAYAIYTHFSELLMDERAKATWIGWLNLQLDAMGFGPTAAAKKHTKEIRGGTLTRKQIRNKARDTFRKAQDSIRYNIVFGFMFKELGQRIKSDRRMSAVTLSLFEKLQFGVYDQERKYEYAWVVHTKTSSGTSNNDDYFKEGRKTSLYSKKSKSRWCQISRHESLPVVFVSDTSNNI